MSKAILLIVIAGLIFVAFKNADISQNPSGFISFLLIAYGLIWVLMFSLRKTC
jgi:hypothetical protein